MTPNSSLESSLVYISDALVDFHEADLVELADFASARNREVGITGYLYYASGGFMQCLEGERQHVEELIGKITADTRHNVLITVWDHQLARRRFMGWGMRWLQPFEALEIGMETLIRDELHRAHSKQGRIAPNTQSLWRLVDSVANLRQRLHDAC